MTSRKLAPFVTLLMSLLALAGCASGTPAAVSPTPAPHPMLGFASPAGGRVQTERTPRFESERMLPRKMALSGSWAR